MGGIFYILLGLFPYVLGQVKERWLRRVAKKWIKCSAAVTEQSISGGWSTKLEIRYLFDVNGEPHVGTFQRRYLMKGSADSEPVYEPGAGIEVLVDPKNPDRSYFPHPLSLWGLMYAVPIVAVAILALFAGVYAGLEQRHFDEKHRIPASEWKRVRYSRVFNISFPGNALPGGGTDHQMALGNNIPFFDSWQFKREGYSFTAILYEYPLPFAPDTVFALIKKRNLEGLEQPLPVERPLVYFGLKSGQPFTWPGSTGRRFEYSQPAWAEEVYVSGRSVYVIFTNWYVQSDVKVFFDSFQPVEGLN
jgi:hypothetical protein